MRRGLLLKELAQMSGRDAVKAFGPNGVEVRDFILSLLNPADYPWFQNIYRKEPWDQDPHIVRVQSWRRAWALLPTTKRAWLAALRKQRNTRAELQQADPSSPWIKWYMDASYYASQLVGSLLRGKYGEAAGKAAVASEFAASELVLQRAVPNPPHFFLDLMPYWQQGHWPIGVRDDDKLMVF